MLLRWFGRRMWLLFPVNFWILAGVDDQKKSLGNCFLLRNLRRTFCIALCCQIVIDGWGLLSLNDRRYNAPNFRLCISSFFISGWLFRHSLRCQLSHFPPLWYRRLLMSLVWMKRLISLVLGSWIIVWSIIKCYGLWLTASQKVWIAVEHRVVS